MTAVPVFFDFDGVFNFDASRSQYRKNTDGFGYLRKTEQYAEVGGVPARGWLSGSGFSSWFTLNWAGELVHKMKQLQDDTGFDWVWLTSWVGNTHRLNYTLGLSRSTGDSPREVFEASWDAYPAGWRTMSSEKLNEYRHQKKLDVVLGWVEENPGCPFVWVDDEATVLWEDKYAQGAEFLVLKPDSRYGLTRTDFALLSNFLTNLP